MQLIDQVILVDEQDNALGSMEKMEAHRTACLHRAFSVFLFDKQERMLLQKRAEGKYHSPNLWTNTCCSHPKPGETVVAAAKRRLQEEIGISTTVNKAFDFIYKASLDQGMTEYEFDHVMVGLFEGPVFPNQLEVADYLYVSLDEIANDLKVKPDEYTVWFQIAFPKLKEWLQTQKMQIN